MDFDFNFAPNQKKQEETKKEKGATHRAGKRHISRKAISEKTLEELLPWHFENGDCIHCISMGDIDSFSYAKHIIKSEPIEYMLLSTWCMAGEDVAEIGEMLKRGIIKKCDFYVGEIFEKSYPVVNSMVLELAKKYGCRVCVFRNHSKVFVLKGENTFVIESSANVNTNPRCENTVITVDKELGEFYINFYSNIVNFNKNNDKWWENANN